MHLVIVTCELATANHTAYGLASFTANLARLFRGKGHKVTVVVAATKDENLIFDEDIAVKATYIEKKIWDEYDEIGRMGAILTGSNRNENRKFIVNYYKSKQVKNVIEEIKAREKIDIIHVCNVCSLSLGFGQDIPYVVRISSYQNMWDGADLPEGCIDYDKNPLSINNKLEIYTLKRARYVISPSNFMAEMTRQEIGIDPVIIESPFTLNENGWDYKVYDSLVKGKNYIIHYGRLSYCKGTHIVAGIAREILRKYPDLTIVLAGNYIEMANEYGEKVKAYELVRECAGEYSDRVIYAGCLTREQLYPLIQNANLCLLPSRIENLSNACIEALAMNKIVIATEGVSFEQLIENRVNGFLCKRDDPSSFLQAVEEALAMEEDARKKMEAEASKRIAQLAPDVIYEKYLAFYQKVIGEWEAAGA